MGNCGSNQHDSTNSKKISTALEADKRVAKKEMKLLLLGAGESGKSTIFKQVRLIHSTGFSEEEFSTFVPVIRRQCIEFLGTLVQGASELGLLTGEPETEALTLVKRLEEEGLCDELVDSVNRLWKSHELQETYARRAAIQLPDSAKHFLDQFSKIVSATYVPTQEDMLLARVRTTGVSEMMFQIDGVTVRLVDVGGQRSERRKWIHCFDDVEAVIFVSAINEYDQVLFEDQQTNRLVESLKLFAEVANSRFFSGSAKILFLNKKDLFEEKIRNVDLNVCFPSYTQGCNYDYGVKFIEQQFRDQYKQERSELYVHVTCATSTGNVRFVFESIRDTVLAFNFSAAGLL